MIITITEFRNHFGKYLKFSAAEDILITRKGKLIAQLTSPSRDPVDVAKSLFGILPDEVTLEQAKEERLDRI